MGKFATARTGDRTAMRLGGDDGTKGRNDRGGDRGDRNDRSNNDDRRRRDDGDNWRRGGEGRHRFLDFFGS
jgi:hypothetical protein